jgi:uncharacterized membrane protein YfcA
MAKTALLLTLAAIGVVFAVFWAIQAGRRNRGEPGQGGGWPSWLLNSIGFLANFFDTLGIGSFATTTSAFRFTRTVDDRLIPGTLNVGHCLPTVAEALIYIAIIEVDLTTLVLLIVASMLGAWLGAGIVSGWSRRKVQFGMGLALVAAALLMLGKQLDLLPGSGEALDLSGLKLGIGLAGNFMLGAFMTLGIGLYAPAMIMVSLLGMKATAAFPIMMGSCAFLMPTASVQFVRKQCYDLRAAIGLTIGGIPGVLIAAYIVRSLPLDAVRWLVVVVVVYTAIMLLRASRASAQAPEAGSARGDTAARGTQRAVP